MRTVSIAFSTDMNYVQHLAVSIASLLKNARKVGVVEVFILYEFLEQGSINFLKKLESVRENTQIDFIKISASDFSSFPLHTGLHSIATYYRLKLPSLLQNYDQILYLDSDIVVKCCVFELWDLFDPRYQIMAVEEPRSLNISRLKSLGMMEASPYFNGGVLFLNLRKMRDKKFEEEASKYINNFSQVLLYQDQDVLNALSERDWKPLPLKYNSFSFVFKKEYEEDYLFYTKQDLIEARVKPGIIHFNQHPKPWVKGCTDIRIKEYFKYIKLTEFRSFYIEKNFLDIIRHRLMIERVRLRYNHPLIFLVLKKIKNSWVLILRR